MRPSVMQSLVPWLLLGCGLIFPALELLAPSPAGPVFRYPWINHDALSLLLTGRQIVEGRGDLYRGVWDPNFPAIHTLCILANEVHLGWGLEVVDRFHLGLLALAAFGGTVLGVGLRSARPAQALSVLGAYLFVLVCPTVPATPDVGQREHLFALVLLPWLAWRLGVIQMPPILLRLPLAFLVGWLGTIKPTFIMIPAVIELARTPTEGRPDPPEAGAVLAGAVAPLVPFAMFDPVTLWIFVREVLPVHLLPWYRTGFGIPWHEVLRRPQAWVALIGTASLATLLWRGARRGIVRPGEVRGWAAAVAAAGLAPVVQGTGFAYHFIPLLAVLGLGLAVFAGRVLGARGTATAAVVAVGLGWMSFTTTVRWGRQAPSPVVRVVPPGSRVAILTTDVAFVYDAWFQSWVFEGAGAARVLLEGQLNDPDPVRRATALAAERTAILESIRSQPAFLLVRASPVRGHGSLEDALIRDLRVLPVAGYRRLSDAELGRRAGPDAGWVVYARQRVR